MGRSYKGLEIITKYNRWVLMGIAGLAIFALALFLAWVSSGYMHVTGWVSFLGVLILASALLWGGWWAVKQEHPPGWLAGLLVGAALLRLAAGVIWYMALPVYGYGSPPEQAGYVMSDAYERDRAAWRLTESQKPLLRAFGGNFRRADQYGGALFLSAVVYRYLGGEQHQPLLVVVFTAAFSALALLFGWALAKRAWDLSAAAIVAWVVALFPDAILLGGSQMREAFLMTLVVVAFWGMLRYLQDRRWLSLGWVLAALLISLLLSPPFTALLLFMLVIQGLATGKGLWRPEARYQRRLWLILAGLAVFVLASLWFAWQNYAPESVSNPIGLIAWWIRKSAEWQAHLTASASGWVQKTFKGTPDWLNLPLLLLWGIVQPFLPAAVSDVSGSPLWQGVAIWRSLGWALLLPFLVYAPWRALRWNDVWNSANKPLHFSVRALSLVVWLGIVIAAFRGGGDQWDNPRYRVAFIGLQAALAAWVWVAQRHRPDPWLRRILVGVAIIIAWFVPWYLRRYVYLSWPVVDIFKLLGVGVASAILYWIWDWARTYPQGDE